MEHERPSNIPEEATPRDTRVEFQIGLVPADQITPEKQIGLMREYRFVVQLGLSNTIGPTSGPVVQATRDHKR